MGDETFDKSCRETRQRWLDAGAMAIAALMVTVWVIDPEPEPKYAGPGYYIVSYTVGVLSIFAQWWRRKYGIILAITLIVGSIVLPILSGPSLIALFSVASHRRLVPTLWITVLALISAPMQILVGTPLAKGDFWKAAIPLGLGSLLVVGWGMAMRSRREVVRALGERAEQLARERDLVADWARRVEREEIARDMHDSLAHRLSLISMSAGALSFRRDQIPSDLAELAATLQKNSNDALAELRTVVGGVRLGRAAEVRIDRDSARASILELVEESRASGQDVEAEVSLAPGLPPNIARIAYRAVQELLTNARKHSSDRLLTLVIAGNTESGLSIRSTNAVGTDNGRGSSGGFGLMGMAERIKVHDGWLTAGRTVADKFEVEVWLPWEEK